MAITPKQTAARIILEALVQVQSNNTASTRDLKNYARLSDQRYVTEAKAEKVVEFVEKLTDPLIDRFSKLAKYKEEEGE